MKFGQRLRKRLMKPEWKGKYVDYKALKKTIKHLSELTEGGKLAEALDLNATFMDTVKAQARRANEFYHAQVKQLVADAGEVTAHLEKFVKEYQKVQNTPQALSEEQLREKLEPIIAWMTHLEDVGKFAVVNQTAARKIIKKHDKITQFEDKQNWEAWVAEENLYDNPAFAQTRERMQELEQKVMVTSTTLHTLLKESLAALQTPEEEPEEPGLLPTAFWAKVVKAFPWMKGTKGQGVVIFAVFFLVFLCYEHVIIFDVKPTPLGTLFYIGIPCAFMLAFANGANDAANSLGTSVGAAALTLRQALLLGACVEALGAMTMGTLVSKTISKGVIEPTEFSDNPDVFAVVMLSVLGGAAITTLIATIFGYPISATHGIIAGLFGVGLVAKGGGAIGWTKMAITLVAWIASPMLGTICSAAVYYLIQKAILLTEDPKGRSEKLQPVFIGIVFGIASLFILIKGPKQVKIGSGATTIWAGTLVSIAIGLFCAFISFMWARAKKKKSTSKTAPSSEMTTVTPGEAVTDFNSEFPEEEPMSAEEKEKREYAAKMQGAEAPFVSLLIISALTVAFAHGSNDVGNAVGPLAGIMEVFLDGTVSGKPDIAIWALSLGAIGFVVGILTLGTLSLSL
eukprot:TRINITY_DN196_c0_g1_i20.p1 TRINITY_DN196_c0_g1~~TRINITY_DN196_c0_g1_i20.p1  ORF type:complete len:634 (-),score=157.41 TRINITY_DN196_c0_g1_i20:283-2160(-)